MNVITLKFLPEYSEFSDRQWRLCFHAKRVNELNPERIQLVSFLLPGEKSISGEEKMRRAEKSGLILLDARVAEALHRSKLIPKAWIDEVLQKNAYFHHSKMCISFDGTRCSEKKWIPEIETEVLGTWMIPCLTYRKEHYVRGLCGGDGVVETWENERYGLRIDSQEYATSLSATYPL